MQRAVSVILKAESLRAVGSSMTGKMEKAERENRQLLRKFYVKESREIRWWQEETIVRLCADENYSWLREKAMINKREGRIAGVVSLRRGDELDLLNKRRDCYQMGRGKIHSWKQEGKQRMRIWPKDADKYLEAHVGLFKLLLFSQ